MIDNTILRQNMYLLMRYKKSFGVKLLSTTIMVLNIIFANYIKRDKK